MKDSSILVYRRDEDKAIEGPGLWDLPGGGREGDESPEQCVLRELEEEFGLLLPPERLLYRRRYAIRHPRKYAWFFAGTLYEDEIAAIRFGSEGQYWQMMRVADYLANPDAVARHQERLRHCLEMVLEKRNGGW